MSDYGGEQSVVHLYYEFLVFAKVWYKLVVWQLCIRIARLIRISSRV